MHPLLQEVSKAKYGCKFDGIPNSSEKLLSLTIIPPPGDAYSIRVIDSLQFMMMGSLSSLVENQKKEMEMKTMEEWFPKFCEAFDKKDMTETQKPSSSRRMSFPMSGWTLMTNSSGQPVETMPLKSPVDFAKKTQSQHSARLPPHLPPLW